MNSASKDTFDIDAMSEQAGKATTLLAAMCNRKRLLLLCQLIDGETTVNELVERLALPQSTVSQHLGLLRRHKLVRARRDGQTQLYSLAGEEARAILQTLQNLYCDPQAQETQDDDTQAANDQSN